MINITINEDSLVNVVSSDKNNRTTSKTCSLEALVNSLTSLKPEDTDTGFLFPNLLREVKGRVVKRFYYYPSLVTTVKVQNCHSSWIKENPYFHVTDDRDDCLEFKEFKIKDVCGVFINSSTTSFNNTSHFFGVLNLGLDNNIKDTTEISLHFPNHFSDHICWANNFNKSALSSLDYRTQSSSINQYYSSMFNTDLFNSSFRDIPSELNSELETFLSEVLTERGLENINYIHKFFITYYFFTTIKNINPSRYIRSSSRTLQSF